MLHPERSAFCFTLFTNWLGSRKLLALLFVVNVFGTIYGYYWYKNQLLSTDWWLLPFVPDSPTASLFFSFVLLAFLLGRKWPLLEAFAAITLVKYGIWATVMIFWTASLGGPMYWEHYMLVFSHLGMALQAVLYAPFFSFRKKHLVIVAVWVITNDIVDYTLGVFPWLHSVLHPHLTTIAWFTFGLSLFSVALFYVLVIRRRTKKYGHSSQG
jgi:uncharacterized membrane protein YpjA